MCRVICLITITLCMVSAAAVAGIVGVQALQITDASAVIEWQTTVSATTELSIGVVGQGGMEDLPMLPGPPSQIHSYPVSGLQPDTDYVVMAKSFDPEMGEYLTCDDGTSPAYFSTLGAVPVQSTTWGCIKAFYR